MDVFGWAATESGAFLRDAAIAAGYDLGLYDALSAAKPVAQLAAELGGAPARLRALVDVLVALGALVCRDDGVRLGAVPPRPVIARAGWGLLADVIRSDRPLDAGDARVAHHAHLASAGAEAARELVPLLGDGPLVDLGGGAGAYTAAFLDARPARATIVDVAEVLPLARAHLARFGDRVRFVAADARVDAGAGFGAALLANVLHLHGPADAAALCAAAARAIVPGGIVAIKELRVDEDRGGPLVSLLFALNMALYTAAGDVYEVSQLRAWLVAAGLVGLEEHRLAAAPDMIVLTARRP